MDSGSRTTYRRTVEVILGYNFTLSQVKFVASGFPISEDSNEGPLKEILNFGFIRSRQFQITSARILLFRKSMAYVTALYVVLV
jgi:hypothetical protein